MPGTPLLDLSIQTRETEAGQVKVLYLRFGALRFAIELDQRQTNALLRDLVSGVRETPVVGLPVQDMSCQPLPTKGRKYLELNADTLNARRSIE